MLGGDEKYIVNFSRKLDGKRPLEKSGRIWDGGMRILKSC